MGAGMKTETVVQQNKPLPLWKPNIYPTTARNLRKGDLAGVVFGCKHSTFKECVFKQLFGLPAPHFQYVQNITQGMPLFLFNYSDRKLHGIFEALSAGQMNVNRHAWTLDGQEVRVKIRMQCQPLTEDKFRPILAVNYRPHEPTHLWFELDKAQTNKLIALFSASPVSRNLTTPLASRWGNLFRQSITAVTQNTDCNPRTTNLNAQIQSALSSAEADKLRQKPEATPDQDATANEGNVTTSFEVKTWISLFKSQSDTMPNKDRDSIAEDLEKHVPHQKQFSMVGQSSRPQLSTESEARVIEVLANVGCIQEVDAEISSLIDNPETGELFDADHAITPLIKDAESGDLADTEIAVAPLIQNTCESLPDHFLNEGEDTKTMVSDANLSHESNMDWDSSFELLDVPLNATVEERHMVPKTCSESSTVSM